MQKYLFNLDGTPASDYSLWKATAKLKKPQLTNPPIRTAKDCWAKSNSEKAEAFACHVKEVFTENQRIITEEQDLYIRKALAAIPRNEPLIEPFTKSLIKNLVTKNLNFKKASGYDLKELPEKGIEFLTYLFNAILRLNFFPPQ